METSVDGRKMQCKAGMLCAYGDGSSTTGYFVNDNVQIAQVSGNRQTTPMSGNVILGFVRPSTRWDSWVRAVEYIDASAKKVRKMFSHCLDGRGGGGIFAIGEVVHPKIKTTPLIDDQTHYNIVLKSIDVNGEDIKLPTSILDFIKKQAVVVDSGTTLAYFPDEVYNQVQLMEKIMAAQPGKKPHVVENMFKSYKYSGNIDDGFPVVNLHFANSLSLKVLPHQYFFQVEDDEWCIGFQNNIVLSDKLVTYDMEKKVIGWTDYECSSSIKVKDEESGNVYEVGAQDISSSRYRCNSRMVLGLLFVLVAACLVN
ncbi:putative aspartic peptidase A1 family, aspartic peptidase domain superfamily, xylanase inhibitor [Helianthus annuus]|nr:putative aspartic peptidase A1 family, aspartic peptidase domain superfamily, xylanase inhibitor [Helianthus annuus]